MKRSISIITSLLLSISTIAIILFLTVDRSSIERLREVKIQWFILAVLLHFLSWVIWGLRISVMSGHLDRERKINLRESMEITLANLFLAAITPSMAGGEPVRIHLISKKGFGIGRGTALVLGERVFDGIFVLSLVPLSLIVFSTYIHEEVIKLGLLLGLILFLVGISIFVYSVLRPDSVSRLIKSIIKKIKLKRLERNLESLFEKVDGFVDAFHKGARDIFKRENKVGILIIALLTASFWFIEFLIPSCILLGLDQDPIIIQSISAQILLLIIVMIPLTPGSSGVAEGCSAILYSAIIPDRSVLGIMILAWRFITYHLNIIVGGIFQYKLIGSLSRR